jgi:Asp-tRNA(Asn)/Glu-tRNA(Gln) amidotransferase A subunit family amidase
MANGIVLGKTNTPEWGAGANTRNAVYGATGNPFDPAKSAAGSSGGSAAALATGMAPLCSGSDTGGSLRNPAAFCGVVGFRPSPGLVPSETRLLGWSSLSVNGPMARTVRDACLFLSVLVSDDGYDPSPRPSMARPFAAGEISTSPNRSTSRGYGLLSRLISVSHRPNGTSARYSPKRSDYSVMSLREARMLVPTVLEPMKPLRSCAR